MAPNWPTRFAAKDHPCCSSPDRQTAITGGTPCARTSRSSAPSRLTGAERAAALTARQNSALNAPGLTGPGRLRLRARPGRRERPRLSGRPPRDVGHPPNCIEQVYEDDEPTSAAPRRARRLASALPINHPPQRQARTEPGEQPEPPVSRHATLISKDLALRFDGSHPGGVAGGEASADGWSVLIRRKGRCPPAA
jgi:hypothetical protein